MPKEHKHWAQKFLEIVEGKLVWKIRNMANDNTYKCNALFNRVHAGNEAGGKDGMVTICGVAYDKSTVLAEAFGI